MRRLSLLGILTVLFILPLEAFAQGGGQRGNAAPPRPAPRWPDGHINLGDVGGQRGLWQAGAANLPLIRPDKEGDFGLFAASAAEPTDPFLASKLKLSQVPFQPWARALFEYRVTMRHEPYTRCKASAGSRQVATAYGTQFIEFPELKRFYIFETGGAHSFREIYLDGRPHPTDLIRTNRGHSIGHFEGDTLVVDTVGFNENVWIDNLGMPTTEQLHTIERFTRTDFNNIRYEIEVDDPGAYTAKWKGGFYMRWGAGESWEFVCQDNNFAPELLVGDGTLKIEPAPFIP